MEPRHPPARAENQTALSETGQQLQGTTSQVAENSMGKAVLKGHGFIRAVNAAK